LLLASIVLVLGAPFISDLRTALIAIGVQIAVASIVLGIGRPPWRRLLPGLFAVASVSFSNWLLSPGHEVSAGALAGLRVAFFVVPRRAAGIANRPVGARRSSGPTTAAPCPSGCRGCRGAAPLRRSW